MTILLASRLIVGCTPNSMGGDVDSIYKHFGCRLSGRQRVPLFHGDVASRNDRWHVDSGKRKVPEGRHDCRKHRWQ